MADCTGSTLRKEKGGGREEGREGGSEGGGRREGGREGEGCNKRSSDNEVSDAEIITNCFS